MWHGRGMKTAKHFTTIDQIWEHLDGLGFFHMDLSLTRMETALSRLGLSRPPFVVAQIVGTNGKGSTSAFLDSLSRAHGCRTGLYTSPHFLSPCERIRIDGVPLQEDLWPELATEVYAARPDLTYFEFLTVLAILAFARQGVQLAVMEAGLGGAHDATTALASDLTCFAPVAMDHAAILGPTLRDIALEKCGAIRPRVPVVSANVFSKQVTEHNVQKDWTFNGNGNASSTLEFFFQVPSLRNTLWGTDDAKQPSLGAFRFGSIWNQSSLKATGTATAHADGGEYTAYRQGNLLVFLDEAGVNKYGFQINESEESEPMTMTLVSVDGQNLDEADRVTYTIDN